MRWPLASVAFLAVLAWTLLAAPYRPTVAAAADLGAPLPALSPEEQSRFEAGASIFSKVHGPEDGLGPLFNAQACAECHSLPGPGGADKTRNHLITRIGRESGDRYDDL